MSALPPKTPGSAGSPAAATATVGGRERRKLPRWAAIVVAVTVLVWLAACLSACGKTNSATVTLSGLVLHPTIITVAPGSTVTWVNGDQTAHTVTSKGIDTSTTLFAKPGPGQFNSGPLNPGQRFSHVFSSPGRFDYYDGIQGYIVGLVIVR